MRIIYDMCSISVHCTPLNVALVLNMMGLNDGLEIECMADN